MRILRAKHVRKTLRFFRMTLGIVPSFRIVLDGTFIVTMVRQKLDPAEAVRKALQNAKCEFFVPASVVRELAAIGAKVASAAAYARTLQTIDDAQGGGEDGVAASSAIAALAGGANAEKYFVATQDKDLRYELRAGGRTPLMYANHAVVVLEAPVQSRPNHAASASSVAAVVPDVGAATAGTPEQRMLADIAQEEAARRRAEEGGGPRKRCKRKAQGPNPLAVRKSAGAGAGAGPKKKRKRKRN
eukprot:g6012.t1